MSLTAVVNPTGLPDGSRWSAEGEGGATTGTTRERPPRKGCQILPNTFGRWFPDLLCGWWSGIPSGCKRIVAREPVVVSPLDP